MFGAHRLRSDFWFARAGERLARDVEDLAALLKGDRERQRLEAVARQAKRPAPMHQNGAHPLPEGTLPTLVHERPNSQLLSALAPEWRKHVRRARALILKRDEVNRLEFLGTASTCEPEAMSMVCQDHPREHPPRVVWPGACGRRSCDHEACVQRTKRRSGEAAERTVCVAGVGLPLCVVTLTFPPELREAVRGVGALAAMRRAAGAMVHDWALARLGLRRGEGWRLQLAEATHPEGDQSPGEWKPHFNFMFSWVAFSKSGAVRRKLTAKVVPQALLKLREYWHAIIEAFFGAPLISRAGTRTGNVHYQFRPGVPETIGQTRDRIVAERAHTRRYFMRSFPGWWVAGGEAPEVASISALRVRYMGAGTQLAGQARKTVEAAANAQGWHVRWYDQTDTGEACVTCGAAMRFEHAAVHLLEHLARLAGPPPARPPDRSAERLGGTHG